MSDHSEPCQFLEWDSNFFGLRIARVLGNTLTVESISQIDSWCHRHNIHCLYFLSSLSDATTTRLAEDHAFRLVDIRVTLAYAGTDAVPNDDTGKDGTIIRHYRQDDLPDLIRIARDAYRDTRFFYDPHFPVHQSQSLYETWIEASCAGYADVVFVAQSGDNVAGYITCHRGGPSPARIGLIGVASPARGQGIGQQLVRTSLEWFLDQGEREIVVVTQGRNIAAQRLYQRCGFLSRALEIWYHKWYS